MSVAAFLRQYRAVGREKGDGYDHAMFADMSERQRARARAMLLRRGTGGDTIDLSGLRFVGDETVVATLRAGAGRGALQTADRDLVVRETLFALTGKISELDPVLAWLDSGNAEARQRAAELLGRLALPPAMAAPIARRLGQWRLGRAALPLAVAWLTTQGISTCRADEFRTHLPLLRRIVNAWPWRRAAVLAGIAADIQSRGHQ